VSLLVVAHTGGTLDFRQGSASERRFGTTLWRRRRQSRRRTHRWLASLA
jgi:hypothetical protein